MAIKQEHALDDSIAFIISRTALRFKCEIGRRVKSSGVTPEQWVLLHRLWEKDGVSQKMLAGDITKDQSSITHMLDKLELKGWVRRDENPEDRRAFVIYLTDSGRKLVVSLFEKVQQLREEACRGLSTAELSALKSSLNLIWENLK